ncbi:MAG: HEAT repeat domain-containing protein [Candidatus Dormibacteraeota bacterium]|nr:HEAT repeat domain-containing protein [Candidatus Dormibacteraeota bacterium]
MLYPELDGLDFAELREKFTGPPLEGPEYAVAYYTEVAVLMRAVGGDDAVAYLLHVADEVADPARTGAAFVALTMPPAVETPAVRELFASHLNDERAHVVMEAIEGLAALRDATRRAQVMALRDHGDPFVRGAVLRYLASLDEGDAIAAAVQALHDPAAVVRSSAIDVLDDAEAVDTAPLIRPFLADSDPNVRKAAEWAVRHLES